MQPLKPFQLLKRIHSSIDQLVMQPLDTAFVQSRTEASDCALITWLFPVAKLQCLCHPRYEVEAIAQHPDHGPLGMVTLAASKNRLMNRTFLDKVFDSSSWQETAGLRISVIDRVHWQRTAWGVRSYAKSTRWAKIPRIVFGIDINDKAEVQIDAVFDAQANRYSTYNLSIPQLKLELELNDTGVDLLSPAAELTPGFADNESALKVIAMGRETNAFGEGGIVYRQPYFATPIMPSIARCSVKQGGFFETELKTPLEFRDPIAAWLIDKVDEIKLYQVEASVEEENEPNTAGHYGDRSLHDRVQRKAMNRYFTFREDVRGKSYADIEGRELPR